MDDTADNRYWDSVAEPQGMPGMHRHTLSDWQVCSIIYTVLYIYTSVFYIKRKKSPRSRITPSRKQVGRPKKRPTQWGCPHTSVRILTRISVLAFRILISIRQSELRNHDAAAAALMAWRPDSWRRSQRGEAVRHNGPGPGGRCPLACAVLPSILESLSLQFAVCTSRISPIRYFSLV
jgi:hypothetical protein